MLSLATLAMLATGCQSARVGRPLTAEWGGNDPETQLSFWHELASRPVTSNDEAFHGLLLYVEGEDPAADYSGRVQTLKARRMLPAGFDAPADRAVDRGTLAVAIVRALSIKGGWALRLFGPTPRYAVKELQYLDLYPPSSPNQTFSGTEFLGIMGKIEDYQAAREDAAGGAVAGVEAGPESTPQVPPEARPGVEPTPPLESEGTPQATE